MMFQPQVSDEFRTSDLGIGAFLLAREFPLLRVEHGRERAVFVFPASAADTAKSFYSPSDSMVSARLFHYSLRELRGLARGDRR
jgi:hypothetical protein